MDVSPHTKIDRLPDWDDLRLLLAVVEDGSLGRASRTLGLTQPTMSRRIRRLEQDLGTLLLMRSSRGVTLTLRAQRIVEELKAAQSAIGRAVGRGAAPGGEEFRLMTTDGLASLWLPRFAATLLARQPQIDLRIFASDDPNRGEAGHFDLAVHDVAVAAPDLVTMRLGTLHYALYATPAYLERRGWPRSRAELKEHCLLDCSTHLVGGGSWLARLDGDWVRARYLANSAAGLVAAVRAGAGIALLPSYVAVDAPDLVALAIDLQAARPFWLSYRREMVRRPCAATLLSFVRQAFDRRRMPCFADAVS